MDKVIDIKERIEIKLTKIKLNLEQNKTDTFIPYTVVKERLPITPEEIICLKEKGLSNRAIAKEFQCSEKTIRNRLKEVRTTL